MAKYGFLEILDEEMGKKLGQEESRSGSGLSP